MDNKATTKRMIGAVVLVLVAALLLAWLLKGKNRDGQQDMAMNQTSDTKPILGFPGVGGEQKPSLLVGEDPNAAAQQNAGAAQQATAQDGSMIQGVDVKLPETVPNTTGLEVRPGGEVRDLVDTDGKVKDGTGSMGTGDAKAIVGQVPPADAGQNADQAKQPEQQAVAAPAPADKGASASQQDKAASSNQDKAASPAPVEKKSSSKVVLVNEKPVGKPQSEEGAKAATAAKEAAAKKAAADKAAADKAAAAKSMELAKAKAAAGAAAAGATAAGGSFSIQVLASSDKAKADAAAAPLKADGYNVAVTAAKVGGKTVYRVFVNGYADRAAAEAAQAKMKTRYKQNQSIQGSFVASNK